MSAYETLAVTNEDAVARIDLNRPDKGNCLNAAMWRELGSAFNDQAADPQTRAIVLGGAGRHFSTGIDLEYLMEIQQTLNALTEG